MKIQATVTFRKIVEVEIPDGLPEKEAKEAARSAVQKNEEQPEAFEIEYCKVKPDGNANIWDWFTDDFL